MKPFRTALPALLALWIWGCGDLFGGTRSGTEDSGASAPDRWTAIFRPSHSIRFPGQSDSTIRIDTLSRIDSLQLPDAPDSTVLGLWNGDSSMGSWTRHPTSLAAIHLAASKIIRVVVVDSNASGMDLAIPGTGVAVAGVQDPPKTFLFAFRSPGGVWPLLLRRDTGGDTLFSKLDSADLSGDLRLDPSSLR
jgi:hypothetical protein